MAKISFNAREVAPNSFEAIPPGKYVAVITNSEFKETKSGKGMYLALTFEIIEGEHKNRKLWSRLNLENPNEKAVEIARGQLSAICHAINVPDLNDTAQLHDKPIVIRVTQKEFDGEMRNEVRGYFARESAQQPTAPTSVSATSGSAAPWRR